MTVIACSKCGETKDESFFSRYIAHRTGRRPDCKECCSKRGKEYRQRNASKESRRSMEWAKENRDRVREASRKYNTKNVDKRRALSSEWQKKNKVRDAARSAAQRAQQVAATPRWANRGYIELFYGMAKSEEMRTGRRVHVDHIYPLNSDWVCGLHVEDNLQLLFAEDNIAKKNRRSEHNGGGLSR